jgi:hopene-associated glycosyltransferase HpnB
MIDIAWIGLTLAAVIAWILLLGWRGGFWRADQRLPPATRPRTWWPAVTAIIPARDEAETIERAVASLVAQDYPGELRVIVVDDASQDGTAERARAAVPGPRPSAVPSAVPVAIMESKPLPPGWVGKIWAVAQGIDRAEATSPRPAYFLLADADVEHAPDNVRRLVDKAEREGRDLVSLMVMLHTGSFWERLLVPSFVFFFQKLYPFSWVNQPLRSEAAAAGGCMLVRRQTLDRVGGIAAVRDELIDDCALAARIKSQGSIWLGLSDDTRSLRVYHTLGGLWPMVTRTAFTQLEKSVPGLIATVLAMIFVYLVPPLGVGYGVLALQPVAAGAGAAGWAMMIIAIRPTLSLYRLPWWWGVLLPFSALLFTLMTIDSARLHWQGRGGTWKGRRYGCAGSGSG